MLCFVCFFFFQFCNLSCVVVVKYILINEEANGCYIEAHISQITY